MADANIGRLVATLSLNSAQFSRGLQGVRKSVQQFGSQMQSVGRGLSLALGVPLAAAGIAAVKTAADFDASLSKIVGLVGVAREQVQGFRGDVLRLAGETARAPQELADALFFITSAGLRGREAIDLLEASAQAAAAGLGDTAVVADAATSAMNAFKSANLSGADAVGILVGAVREGKAEADSIAGALGRVIPIAAETGVSFDQVAASIAALTRIGLPADLAVTALQATLSTLLNPAKQSKDALVAVGLSAEGLRRQLREEGLLAVLSTARDAFAAAGKQITELFPNVRALTSVFGLVGENADEVRAIFEALGRAGREDLAASFAEAASTARFLLDRAVVGLRSSMIKLGDAITPVVLPALERLTDFMARATEAFGKLSPQMKRLAVVLGGVAIAAGPVLVILGVLTAAVAVIGGPITIAIAAVAALGAAFIAFREQIIEAVGDAMDFIKEFPAVVLPALNLLFGPLVSLATAFSLFRDEITEALTGAIDNINSFFVDGFTKVRDDIEDRIDSIKDLFGGLVEFLLDRLPGPLKAALGFIAGEAAAGTGAIQAGLGAAAGAIDQGIDVIVKKVDEGTADIRKGFAKIFTFEGGNELAEAAKETADALEGVDKVVKKVGEDAGNNLPILTESMKDARAAIRDTFEDLRFQVRIADLDTFAQETARAALELRVLAEAGGFSAEAIEDLVNQLRKMRVELKRVQEEAAEAAARTVDVGQTIRDSLRDVVSGILRGTRESIDAAEILRDILISIFIELFEKLLLEKLKFEVKFEKNLVDFAKEVLGKIRDVIFGKSGGEGGEGVASALISGAVGAIGGAIGGIRDVVTGAGTPSIEARGGVMALRPGDFSSAPIVNVINQTPFPTRTSSRTVSGRSVQEVIIGVAARDVTQGGELVGAMRTSGRLTRR